MFYPYQKITRRGLLLLLLLPLLFGRVAGPVALAQSTTVLVAVDPSFPPFARLNAQGEPEGFDVDLMNALAAEAGFAVSFEAVQFRYLLSGLVTHLYDIGAGCIFINEERASYVNFSQPYFATGDALIVQADNSTITQPSDLTAETVVGVLQGSLAEAYGRDQTAALLLPVASIEDVLNQLDAGGLNAVLAGEESLFGYEQMYPAAKLKRVGDLLTYQECSFALEKNNTELLVKLNTAMTTLKSNGGVRQRRSNSPKHFPVILHRVTTLHPFKHFIATRLSWDMEVLRTFGKITHSLKQIVRHILRKVGHKLQS